MAFSKNRRLADLVSSAGEVSSFVDASVTHADLHTSMDLTGKTVTVANASTGDNDTTAANTAFVQQEIAALVDSAPGTLNTLNELAAALGDDASFSTTVTNSIATKLPLAGGTMTGAIQLNANDIDSTSTITLDAATDINLDADGGNVYFKDGGSTVAQLFNSSSDVVLKASQSNKDILFRGVDDGSEITALTLDMSEAGHATFNDGAVFGGTGALRIPQGTTGQRPSAATGQLRWNTTDGALEIYNGSAWTAVGSGSSNKILNTFTGDGSTAAFTLTVTPANEDALMVFIDGVYQEKGDYSLSSAVLTLDTAPASGEKVACHITTASVHDGTSAVNQQFTGDGSTTAFTLSSAPGSENNTQVYVNGVYQVKTAYSVSGTTLTFSSAPANSAVIEVNSFTVTTLGNTDTVSEGSSNLYHTTARARSAISATGTGLSYNSSTGVLTSSIANDSVNSQHYVDGSIDTAHIANDAVTTDKLANSINDSIASKASTGKAIAMAIVFG